MAKSSEIKKLKWEELRSKHKWEGTFDLGSAHFEYSIYLESEYGHFELLEDNTWKEIVYHKTLKEAKEAAQKDFEKSIRKALV